MILSTVPSDALPVNCAQWYHNSVPHTLTPVTASWATHSSSVVTVSITSQQAAAPIPLTAPSLNTLSVHIVPLHTASSLIQVWRALEGGT